MTKYRTRLRSLRLRSFLSFADVEVSDLPDVVILFGENGAGKSNFLRGAVLAGQAVSWALSAEADEALLSREREPPVSRWRWPARLGAPDHLPSWGSSEFRIDCRLEQEDGSSHELSVEGKAAGRDDSELVIRGELDGLRNGHVRHVRASILGEDRAWHREFPPVEGYDPFVLPSIFPDGAGVKAALFRAANHVDPRQRSLFYDDFADFVKSAPFGLSQPPFCALGANSSYELILGTEPIESQGAGARHWLMMAAVAAVAEQSWIGLEEPETGLSWTNQHLLPAFLEKLAGRAQLFVSSHAPHVVGASESQTWFKVERESRSRIKRCQGADDLWSARERPPEAPKKGTMVLFPGNIIRLPETVVRHLGLQQGDRLVASTRKPDFVELESEDHYLGDT